jgi:predicted Zn-ribbon and HTH transcriptional regulator
MGETPKKIRLTVLACKQCGHQWVPRSTELPKICPNVKCHSLRWNVDGKAKNMKDHRTKK